MYIEQVSVDISMVSMRIVKTNSEDFEIFMPTLGCFKFGTKTFWPLSFWARDIWDKDILAKNISVRDSSANVAFWPK